MKMIDEIVIDEVFSYFKRIYCEKWDLNFYDDEDLAAAKHKWRRELLNIEVFFIMKALNSCSLSSKKTPPTLSDFKNLCKKEMTNE